jgi:HK97 family phage prohead protease
MLNMAQERLTLPVEFKFATGDNVAPGTFEGRAAAFNNMDWHGDIIKPGAFTKSLADHKDNGTMPGMYAEHSFAMFGGDPLPIGAWHSMVEDEKGLHAVGKISALDSDHGKRIYGLMKDGALKSLSIAFSVPDGGSEAGAKPTDPKRWLKAINLVSVDVVRNPSNPEAQVSFVKAIMAHADRAGAVDAISKALALHRDSMSGGDSMNAEERSQMHDHLRAAMRCLTGNEPKSAPETIRDFEDFLRHPDKYPGFSNRIAREIAAHGWKTAKQPRDEAAAVAEAKATRDAMRGIAEAAAALHGLTIAA